MFKYREFRDYISDSMKTVREFETIKELADHLQAEVDKYGPEMIDCSKITFEKYGEGIDDRIGWDDYAVYVDGCLFGFTDGMPND